MSRQAKGFLICLCFFCILATYYYMLSGNLSGFVFSRMADLVYQLPDGDITIGYHSFPVIAGLFGTLSIVLDVEPDIFLFLPFSLTFGVISINLLIRATTRYHASLLVGFGVVFYMFAPQASFQEYNFAMAIYPFFLYIYYRFIKTFDKRWALLSIVYFFVVLFLSIRHGQWATGLIIVWAMIFAASTLTANAQKQINNKNAPYAIAVLSLVVFLTYNPKFYDQLIFRFVDIFKVGHQSTIEGSEYAAASGSPELLPYLNIFWFLLATTPIIISFLYLSVAESWNPLNRSIDELFYIAVLIGASTDVIIRIIIGRGLTLRTVALLSPLMAVFYTNRQLSNKFFVSFGLVFLVTSTLVFGIYFVNTDHRETIDDEAAAGTAEFVVGYGDANTVLTDHNTWSELRLALAKQGTEPRSLGLYRYNDQVMRMLFEFERPPDSLTTFLVLNEKNIDKNILPPRDWGSYRPLADAPDGFQSRHIDLNKVYDSGQTSVLENTQA